MLCGNQPVYLHCISNRWLLRDTSFYWKVFLKGHSHCLYLYMSELVIWNYLFIVISNFVWQLSSTISSFIWTCHYIGIRFTSWSWSCYRAGLDIISHESIYERVWAICIVKAGEEFFTFNSSVLLDIKRYLSCCCFKSIAT